MNASRLASSVLFCFLAASAWAGQYQLAPGRANEVVVRASVKTGEPLCNLLVSVQGQAPVERQVRAPGYEARLSVTPEREGPLTLEWLGQAHREGASLVPACPSGGQTRMLVAADNRLIVAGWTAVLSRMGQAKAECMRTALRLEQVRHDWYDLRDPQEGAEDWKIQRAFAACEAFVDRPKAWGDKSADNHACALASLKTRCQGYFAEKGSDGKLREISADAALRLQLDGRPWTTGVRENTAVKAQRLQRERAEQARLERQEQERLLAEEKEREREAREAQERMVAEEKERIAKAEATRKAEAEEKERLEKERLEKRNFAVKAYDSAKEKVRGFLP
jgi:hypothetical protein